MRERKDNQDMIRDRVKVLHSQGVSFAAIGERLGKSPAAIRKIVRRMEGTGNGDGKE